MFLILNLQSWNKDYTSESFLCIGLSQFILEQILIDILEFMFKILCKTEKLSIKGILLHMGGNEKHQNHKIKNYSLMEKAFINK